MLRTEIQQVKQRFGIIGNSEGLNRAIDIALQVAPTDLSVLITGESGVGKESFPKIIHQNSLRKHDKYIAVNCGAIPEGTIDSELFGHEKGSFTGATGERKGYFEEASGGTIFLDEVGELPMSTQARLLRVLESGEFIKVGSSKVLKTNVRIVAATNVDIMSAIKNGKFREDLYYRLNTVPIQIPALRERREDIALLFRKFAGDFAEKYRMPAVQLNEEARFLVSEYHWPGNIRQLKNIAEQISIIETRRDIDADIIKLYLPKIDIEKLPTISLNSNDNGLLGSEREILYKVIFEMRKELDELKKIVYANSEQNHIASTSVALRPYTPVKEYNNNNDNNYSTLAQIENYHQETHSAIPIDDINSKAIPVSHEYVEESISLEEMEKELIKQALIRNNGKRKKAADELKISERTLYRKIKEYDLE